MAPTATRPRGPAEHLITRDDILAYLKAALEDGDSELLAAALRDIARTKGIPASAMLSALAPLRRRFTVAEYYAMADVGILEENDRIELLDGDLIVKPPISVWHAFSVDRFANTLPPLLQGRAIVSVQNPTRLNDSSEPQPDIMLLRWRDDFYGGGHPEPADVLLLIEVSDTSVDYDRSAKLPAYARAGIPEYGLSPGRIVASKPTPNPQTANTPMCDSPDPAKASLRKRSRKWFSKLTVSSPTDCQAERRLK